MCFQDKNLEELKQEYHNNLRVNIEDRLEKKQKKEKDEYLKQYLSMNYKKQVDDFKKKIAQGNK